MIDARLLALSMIALACLSGPLAQAEHGAGGGPVPESSSWHAGYYHTMWGRPVALVVPPTATHQTNWGWGIGNTRVNPIYPQYLGPMNSGVTASSYGPYRPTPYYVSDTLQFGVYYIRGPW